MSMERYIKRRRREDFMDWMARMIAHIEYLLQNRTRTLITDRQQSARVCRQSGRYAAD